MKCEYGCNQEAKYQLKNKKWCCSEFYASCPELRRKNSEKVKQAHREGRIPTEQLNGHRGWAKGLTKQISDGLRRSGEAHSLRLKKMGNKNPLVQASIERSKTKNHISYIKQASTRKKLYAQGLLTPAKGIGRGKYSYLIFKDKKYLLRSTFEFIFALYLLHKKINFGYENIRVQHKGSTRINDFEINGKIYEIKGFRGSHVDKVIEAFEENGFCIRVVYYNILFEIIKFFRRKNIKIDDYLALIVKGHNARQYFELDVEKFQAQVMEQGDKKDLKSFGA